MVWLRTLTDSSHEYLWRGMVFVASTLRAMVLTCCAGGVRQEYRKREHRKEALKFCLFEDATISVHPASQYRAPRSDPISGFIQPRRCLFLALRLDFCLMLYHAFLLDIFLLDHNSRLIISILNVFLRQVLLLNIFFLCQKSPL